MEGGKRDVQGIDLFLPFSRLSFLPTRRVPKPRRVGGLVNLSAASRGAMTYRHYGDDSSKGHARSGRHRQMPWTEWLLCLSAVHRVSLLEWDHTGRPLDELWREPLGGSTLGQLLLMKPADSTDVFTADTSLGSPAVLTSSSSKKLVIIDEAQKLY